VVGFDETTFTGGAGLTNATFTGDARFTHTTFTGEVFFDNTTFTGDVRFDNTTFTGDARFDNATFTGGAIFEGATFTSDGPSFDDARVLNLDAAWSNARRFWPPGWSVRPDSADPTCGILESASEEPSGLREPEQPGTGSSAARPDRPRTVINERSRSRRRERLAAVRDSH
jgi:hypothetical protein